MKNLFTLLIFSLFTLMTNLVLQAQSVEQVDRLGTNTGAMQTPRDSKWRVENKELKGNPFLFQDWNTKVIVYSKGNLFEGDSLNYHIYSDEIVSKEKDSFFVYNTQLIDSVKINDKRLHQLNGKFYEVLQKGSKASLYKKYKAKIVRGKYNSTHGIREISRFEITERYYIFSLDKLKKFKPSERRLENVFEDQAQEMKKIMKAGNLDFKKEDDLIRIFESFNSI